MKQEIIENIKNAIPRLQLKLQEPMSQHTTFCVGGNAAVFMEIENQEELCQTISFLSKNNLPYFVLGKGSNLLVSDRGYDGCILHLGEELTKIEIIGNQLTAQAGATLAHVAEKAAQGGLTGFEFASGIPGSVGGAAMMNAGAYGGEMSHVISHIKGIDYTGTLVELNHEEMKFGYRNSVMKEQKITVLEVTYTFQKGNKEDILIQMEDLNNRRNEKQPLEYPSAGSTFKRPEGYFAGKLIMDAGLKGMSVGGAQVSEKHCGFVINKDHATAEDIWHLICEIKEKVYHHAGVMLEPEVILLGDFD